MSRRVGSEQITEHIRVTFCGWEIYCHHCGIADFMETKAEAVKWAKRHARHHKVQDIA